MHCIVSAPCAKLNACTHISNRKLGRGPGNIHYLDLFLEQAREGIGLGRDLFPEMLAEICMGAYRARYSYYLGLVAGTRLPSERA